MDRIIETIERLKNKFTIEQLTELKDLHKDAVALIAKVEVLEGDEHELLMAQRDIIIGVLRAIKAASDY